LKGRFAGIGLMLASVGWANQPAPDIPSADDIALAYQRSDERDAVELNAKYKGVPFKYDLEGLYPNIQSVSCVNTAAVSACSYRKVEAANKIYFPCRGKFERVSGQWAFQQRNTPPKLTEDETMLPSLMDQQVCSRAYRPLDHQPPTSRSAKPKLSEFRKIYKASWTPHAIFSCRNKVRSLVCKPVSGELAQYDCSFQDKHVGSKDWIARQTVIEFREGWRYAEGDEPKCTLVGWDLQEPE
jgi:hypothetical protein